MPDLFLERHMPHLPERLFGLVGDLDAYPRFIPNCKEMVATAETGRANTKLARMTVSFGPLTQSYTSRVVFDPKALTISVKAIDGPFAYLDSTWSFAPEGAGTRVRFDIDFKFSNPLVGKIAEPAFVAKQDEIMQAFADEADRRFGISSASPSSPA